MADFVKRSDLDFAFQIQNFNTKLPEYAALFNLSAAELTSAAADAEWATYIISRQNAIPAYAQNWTKLKNQARYGGDGTIIPPFPAAPDVSTPPSAATVKPNIEGRFRLLAGKIKAHENYQKAIGEDLMIESPETAPNFGSYKPVFALDIVAEQVVITWKKLKSDGIYIDKRIDNGSFFRLDFDLTPNYIDKSPLPPAGTIQKWTYRLRYFKSEQAIGEYSTEQTITMIGQ
jgi:hypothetical protein